MSKAIGIDLGTTNSCVCVVEAGKPTIIPNTTGGRTTASVVAFTKDGERLVGEPAIRQAALNSDRTISSVKRQMGTSWKKNIDGKNYSAQEISAMILRNLRENAEAYLGQPVKDVVITVPAYFNDVQRQATKDAGKIAGLNVLRIINEPTSAALAYGLDNGAAQKIMVFDLGGGTFDVSIIEIGDGVIEVLATNGDNHLGGDDFDERIRKHLLAEFKKQYKCDISNDPQAMQRIVEAAEAAKKELSAVASTDIVLPFLSKVNGEMVHFQYTLTRSLFDELTRDLVNRTEVPVMNALNDAGIAPKELSKVLLVGGSTRIPAVQDKVKKLIGIEPSKSINPDECVAQGAALQAEILSGGAITVAGSELLLLDVTPLSLSIETVGGVATRLVERNSTLPIHYSQVFTTSAPYQRSVEINVLQGERPMAADNKSIGKFTLSGIKRAMAGVPQIEVTFDIDTNGILKVSALDLDTRKEQSITISADDRMSDAEIEAARRDAEAYAASDNVRREALNLSNDAQMLLNKCDQTLKTLGKEIDKEEKKQLKEASHKLKAQLAKYKPASASESEISALRTSMAELEAASASARARANIQ